MNRTKYALLQTLFVSTMFSLQKLYQTGILVAKLRIPSVLYFSRLTTSNSNESKTQDDLEENDPRKSIERLQAPSSTRLGMLAWDYAEYVNREGVPDATSDMSAWEAVANRKIRDGMKSGEFKNLKGEGKPLEGLGWSSKINTNDKALAEKLLRNANVSPEWVQVRPRGNRWLSISMNLFVNFCLNSFCCVHKYHRCAKPLQLTLHRFVKNCGKHTNLASSTGKRRSSVLLLKLPTSTSEFNNTISLFPLHCTTLYYQSIRNSRQPPSIRANDGVTLELFNLQAAACFFGLKKDTPFIPFRLGRLPRILFTRNRFIAKCESFFWSCCQSTARLSC
jgi:hypothetical protein